MSGSDRVPPPTAPRVNLPALAPLPTAAERAAAAIREGIFNGEFMPGTPLPEATLAEALQVSRSTVRDALRMLINEHLLSYEVNRGVRVRSLRRDDLHDIYWLRSLVESAAIEALGRVEGEVDLGGLQQAVEAGEQAEKEGRWRDVGTNNVHFHLQLAATLASPRTDEIFRRLMTELRLGFLGVADLEALHRPYVAWNRTILDLLVARRYDAAQEELAVYLRDAEQQIAAELE